MDFYLKKVFWSGESEYRETNKRWPQCSEHRCGNPCGNMLRPQYTVSETLKGRIDQLVLVIIICSGGQNWKWKVFPSLNNCKLFNAIEKPGERANLWGKKWQICFWAFWLWSLWPLSKSKIGLWNYLFIGGIWDFGLDACLWVWVQVVDPLIWKQLKHVDMWLG